MLLPYDSANFIIDPNNFVRFYHIEISPAATCEKCFLMLHYNHSAYCWFLVLMDTLTRNMVNVIFDWFAALVFPRGLMSDSPPTLLHSYTP